MAYLHQRSPQNRKALLANSYEQFYARVAPFTTPFLSMLLLCSTYFTVLLSGDRYFLICWPLIAEKIRTRKVALRLVSFVFIFVNIYILPHWFEYRTAARYITTVQSVNNSTTNMTNKTSNVITEKLVEVAYTKIGSNTLYLSIYRFYLNVPITFVIPFTLLTLCNGSMIHQLYLIKMKKKRLGHRMKADIRITIMLIIIVLTFMLCRSVNLFVNLFVQISPCLNQNSLQRFNTFANLLIAFNGFINFFLFAVFGQRFREMVLYIFLRHGQYPFLTQVDGISGHRHGIFIGIPTADLQERKSRRYSANDSDLWAAMARRRSSATMAVLYHQTETRPRSISHSSVGSSHLTIPKYTNGGNLQNISSSSMNVTESPFPSSSSQQLSPANSNTNANTIQLTNENRPISPTPSCMKRKTDDLPSTSTHRVKFV